MPLELIIEKLVYGGEGLARLKNEQGAARVVLVPLVLPGERVSAEPMREDRGLVRARLETVLESSPQRDEPQCPYFARCGGCHYQHAAYGEQLRFQSEILKETLSRIGKLPAPEPEVLAAEPWQYRNRSQFKVSKRGREFRLGYFERGSQRLLEVEQCPISSPGINALLPVLRELGKRRDFPDGPWELEILDSGSEALLTARGEAGFPETLVSAFREGIPALVSLAVEDSRRGAYRVFGRGHLLYSAAGFDFRVSHGVFFQTNRYLADKLADAATRELQGELALDLFAGAGYFTLPLGRRFARVVAVESNPAAVRDLESNASRAGLIGIEFLRSSAERFLAEYKGPQPEAVLLDPPRAGLSRGTARLLASLGAPTIVYVSCDPATLARDLAELVRAGYRLERLLFVDLFPQTFHIESVAWLRK